jgi:hypothetical protein
MEKSSRERKIKFYLIAIYILLIAGFSAPVVNLILDSNSYEKLLKLVVPALAALFVARFQKSAARLLEGGTFAIPGVYELRQKYLRHVNHLEWAWLVLAGYAAVCSVA